MSDSFASKLENQDLIPFLKKDAIVTIKIGTGFLQQIGGIIPILLEGKTQEDVAKIETLISEKKELEPWMSAVATLQVLIRTTFEEADKEGLVEFRPYDESFVDIIKQDNSPSDQSAELSE